MATMFTLFAASYLVVIALGILFMPKHTSTPVQVRTYRDFKRADTTARYDDVWGG